MKIGNAAGLSGLVLEMKKSAEAAVIAMITEQMNQIIAERVTPAAWEISTTVNFYMGKADALEIGNHKGLKLTNQTLSILKTLIEKLIRQRWTLTR